MSQAESVLSTTSRRTLLTGAAVAVAAAPLAGVPTAKASGGDEGLLGLVARWHALRDTINSSKDWTDEQTNAATDELGNIELEIYNTPVTTPAGLLALLDVYIDGDRPPFYWEDGENMEEIAFGALYDAIHSVVGREA